MQIAYFKTAWNDIKSSPGWLGKVLLLGLVMLIPIFGPIVAYGYLYGWARDIAWGIHTPLPPRIFGNEDGRLYSRGFFALVIGLICSLIPSVISVIGSIISGIGMYGANMTGYSLMSSGIAAGFVGMLFILCSLALSFVLVFFQWVGSMRMSIYGNLSAGLQVGKIWAMIRHDFSGLLRIFGMALLLSLVVYLIAMVLVFVVILLCVFAGIGIASDLSVNATLLDSATVGMIAVVAVVAVVLMLIAMYVAYVFVAFINMMVTRALGYWTQQFNVAAWRGQDDPMPFEMTQQYR